MEGVDRCGKTTQVDLLSKSEMFSPSKKMNFPDRTTTIGTMINSYLKSQTEMSDESVHLLFSSNRWECNNDIVKTLNSGVNIVCDRYAYSGVAFTHSKPSAPSLAWCKGPDVGLVRPDAILFLSVDAETAEGRGGFGEERYENTTHQNAVRGVFKTLREMDEASGEGRWFDVNAKGTVEEVKGRIEGVVKEVMEDLGPIKKLWCEGEY
ncbi:hypothetical protein TrRE_jg1103 [Triparma retinervis]|uniref:Thymidylate kinase n=1 Tax=Triparma retinervis TaxID=2557542 RepID=A0A9W7AMR9_9STRA|nr:hypothetical protein TrRE_jg1103 [Triparma retinervis]